MPGLLVSVRSAAEAAAALAGGADVLDAKEPSRGPLGRADPEVWRAVRAVVPPDRRLSVALGELRDWDDPAPEPPSPDDFAGFHFRKLGLAGCGGDPSWRSRWAALRDRLGDGPAWVAVAYADWARAHAPSPEAVVAEAMARGCAGVLFDTWSKTGPGPLEPGPPWSRLAARLRARGLLVVLAGGLDAPDFARLAPLGPDLFAVRGAACRSGDREATIDSQRVARLARAARSLGGHPSEPPARSIGG